MLISLPTKRFDSTINFREAMSVVHELFGHTSYTINFNHFQNILEKENGNSIIEIKLKVTLQSRHFGPITGNDVIKSRGSQVGSQVGP